MFKHLVEKNRFNIDEESVFKKHGLDADDMSFINELINPEKSYMDDKVCNVYYYFFNQTVDITHTHILTNNTH
jgi:hypothetical protein